LCCSNAWCNPTAFQQAFTAFKVKAGEVASATAFRRGAGEPWTYLAGGKNFEFVSIAQVVEPAKDVLQQAGAPLPSTVPEECKPGNPAVYELRASTRDLKSWSYSTRVLRLEHNLQSTQNMSLCNFLQGEENNVTQAIESTLASSEQASDEHSMPKIIPSFFLPLFPPTFPMQCKTASTAFVASKKSVETAYAASQTACQTCASTTPPACPQCPSLLVNYYGKYQAFVSCLKTGDSTSCGASLMQESISLPTECPCAESFVSAVVKTVKAAESCDKTKGVYVDFPAIIPPRYSRAACFAYSDACVANCEPKEGYTMIIPWKNQLFCVIHVGITNTCTPKPPSARQWVETALCAAPSIMQSLGDEAKTLSYWAQLIAVYKSSKNPLAQATSEVKALGSGTFTKAQAIANQANPNEIKEIAEETSQQQNTPVTTQDLIDYYSGIIK